jgi:hypothetical protein
LDVSALNFVSAYCFAFALAIMSETKAKTQADIIKATGRKDAALA